MEQPKNLNNFETDNTGSVEDIQDNISAKLAKMFSFYNEQEFLDEIHGIIPAEIEVCLE